MFNERITIVTLYYFLFTCIQASGFTGVTQDQTSSQPNTLFDDADDLQRQLDNEAREKLKNGRPKTIWVFHFPTKFPEISSTFKLKFHGSDLLRKREINEEVTPSFLPDDYNSKVWDYKDQGKWYKSYPECGGRSQSPIDLPAHGLIHARGARQILFANYDVTPMSLTLMNNGKNLVLFGDWKGSHMPLVYGGAGHSRRYLFYSLTLHWPSEHTIGGLQYPLESQAIHISAEYHSVDEALAAAPRDPQALLGIANLYKYSNHTQKGLMEMVKAALSTGFGNGSVSPSPLGCFNPPFKEYACYQGSLTTPPCTESVLWLVRARRLPIDREFAKTIPNIFAKDAPGMFFRHTQPQNDRKIFFFD